MEEFKVEKEKNEVRKWDLDCSSYDSCLYCMWHFGLNYFREHFFIKLYQSNIVHWEKTWLLAILCCKIRLGASFPVFDQTIKVLRISSNFQHHLDISIPACCQHFSFQVGIFMPLLTNEGGRFTKKAVHAKSHAKRGKKFLTQVL